MFSGPVLYTRDQPSAELAVLESQHVTCPLKAKNSRHYQRSLRCLYTFHIIYHPKSDGVLDVETGYRGQLMLVRLRRAWISSETRSTANLACSYWSSPFPWGTVVRSPTLWLPLRPCSLLQSSGSIRQECALSRAPRTLSCCTQRL